MRVDDDLIDHPKWIAIMTHARAITNTRAEARQLAGDAVLVWLGTLVWGCRVNCDGIVPEDAAAKIAPRVYLTEDEYLDAAPLLVKAGLWHNLPKKRGGPGWEIHDFADYQKGKGQVRLEQTREARKKALYRTVEGRRVLAAVKARDRDHCRYCWTVVSWKARRGGRAGTIDHVDPDGPNSVENCVVSCKSCNSVKGGLTPEEAEMPLREPFFGEHLPEHPDETVSGRDLFANDSRSIRAGGSGRARSGRVGSGGAGSGAEIPEGDRADEPPPPPPPPSDNDFPGEDSSS
jgi:hypothetical protein